MNQTSQMPGNGRITIVVLLMALNFNLLLLWKIPSQL
jgi:hypothetical protein